MNGKNVPLTHTSYRIQATTLRISLTYPHTTLTYIIAVYDIMRYFELTRNRNVVWSKNWYLWKRAKVTCCRTPYVAAVFSCLSFCQLASDIISTIFYLSFSTTRHNTAGFRRNPDLTSAWMRRWSVKATQEE